MFGTDCPDGRLVVGLPKEADRIGALEPECMHFRQIIPELLEPNGGLSVTVSAQQSDHFPEYSDARRGAQRVEGGLVHDLFHNVGKTPGVRAAIAHEFRKSFKRV